MENPLMLPQFAKLVQAHFRKRPLNSRSNRPLHLPDMTFPSTKTFLRRISLRQALPLRAAAFAARFIPAPAQRKRLLRSLDSKRSALDRLMMYARLYGPYAEVRCQYLTGNMRAVWDALSPEEQHQFNFDVRTLDWAEYIQEVHIGGIRRFLLGLDRGESARKAQEPEPQTLVVVPPTVVSTEEAPLPAEAGVAIAVAPPRTATETMTQRRTPLSLASPVAQDEIARLIVAHWWERLLQRAFLGWLVASYTVYLRFQASGLQHLPATGSVVVVTNHSSHLDTGAILVALRGRIKHLHPLAAKDYFFRNAPLAWFSRIFLNAIPFDRQTHVGESLGLTLSLLQRGHSVIFFPEGSRSTTGVIQPFRRGIGVLAVESGVPVVPAYISGAFRSWPKGRALPRPGHVSIRFGPPIIVQRNPETLSDQVRQVTADIQRAVEALAPQQAPARS
jgi:1-acyl-sn-glycerol-3-phosphate acyltransferase